ncbi:hypothetical protein CEXT_280491 [Caerostris extrusa]|uniref:Maturase K n=1 Tax=Caerostris extrusa TaxID=172846 RepID=A0AAV4NYW2_CAEEX|nr:hypothetical protein CEXT_280491 [Caerostris extrusa]
MVLQKDYNGRNAYCVFKTMVYNHVFGLKLLLHFFLLEIGVSRELTEGFNSNRYLEWSQIFSKTPQMLGSLAFELYIWKSSSLPTFICTGFVRTTGILLDTMFLLFSINADAFHPLTKGAASKYINSKRFPNECAHLQLDSMNVSKYWMSRILNLAAGQYHAGEILDFEKYLRQVWWEARAACGCHTAFNSFLLRWKAFFFYSRRGTSVCSKRLGTRLRATLCRAPETRNNNGSWGMGRPLSLRGIFSGPFSRDPQSVALWSRGQDILIEMSNTNLLQNIFRQQRGNF